MEPTLVSGDIVFVDPDASPRTYEDLVVLHVGPVLHVCRIAMLNQGIWLFHDNPAHKDVLLHVAEVKVLGTVKWIERANCAAETA